MIPKKARDGDDTAGLLSYLYGPGKRDEHVDPHMVAAWDAGVEDPARSPEMTIADLALLMDAPVHALLGKKPPKHVYHVAVRNSPEDRVLTDVEWAEVAREMMHAAGIAPHGDDNGCRWVAIRHADDHIHIVATKARQDGRQPNLRQDFVRMQAAARRFEARWGLRRLVSGDKTARRWPKSGENEKAMRRQLAESARETLQYRVRVAAAAATSEADFFARLEAAGVRVKQRVAPDGNVTGYSVALPGDRDGASRAVWFPGSKLAWDLSLPRVRERWQPTIPVVSVAPGEAWQVAEVKVRAAAAQLGAGGLYRGAGDVAALGDLLVTMAEIAPALVREQLRQAAREFERAGRAPGARELEGEARALYRTSSQALLIAVASSGRNDAAAFLGFLLALTASVVAAQRWHQAQEHRAQAEAAGRAGRLLQEAVEVTTGSMAAGEPRSRTQSRGGPRSGERRTAAAGEGRERMERPMASVVQRAVPHHAAAVLADEAWPALRRRLMAIEDGGQDPAEVLRLVAAQRELGTAESVAEVLTWRLDGWTRRPGRAADATERKTARAPQGPGKATGGAGRSSSADRAHRAPGGEQPKGPRRAR